jgi:hypothetical protein
MSTIGGGGVWFLEAQEVKPAARTTAVRSSRVGFIFVDLSLLGFVSVWHYRQDD